MHAEPLRCVVVRWPSRIALAITVLFAALAIGVAHDPAGAQDGTRRRTRSLYARTAATKRAPRRARRARTAPRAEAPSSEGSVSIGRHNSGRILQARRLLESEHVRLKRPESDTAWGTDELIGLLERAAAHVAERVPGSRLTVGDISRRRGGRFAPHRSHRSGRDVDIGFYIVDGAGQPVYTDRFHDFRGDGTTRSDPGWRFDDARNWALVEAMVTDLEAPVQYMFVWRPLRQRLLDHAASIGAPEELLERAAIVLDQPSRGGRHEDHFHMRIYCPPRDRPRCLDEPPFHAWVPAPSAEELAAIREATLRARQARMRAARREQERRERARARRHARRARPAAHAQQGAVSAVAQQGAVSAVEPAPSGG